MIKWIKELPNDGLIPNLKRHKLIFKTILSFLIALNSIVLYCDNGYRYRHRDVIRGSFTK